MRKLLALAGALVAAAMMLAQPATAHDGHARKAQVRHHHHKHCHHHHHRVAAVWRPYYYPTYAVRIYEVPRYSYRPIYYTSWTYPYSGFYAVPQAHYHWRWRDTRW